MFCSFDIIPHSLSLTNHTECNVCLIVSIASWQARLFRASYGAMGENEEVSTCSRCLLRHLKTSIYCFKVGEFMFIVIPSGPDKKE